MDAYFDRYVRGVEDHYAYLDAMGSRQITSTNLPTFI